MPFPLMVYAAGFGTRMGKLTANCPKPLIQVAGKALIDHALDLAQPATVGNTVVNLHYLADQLETHLKTRDVALSHERENILETGGGLKRALPLLGPGAVMTLNSDAVWTGKNPLSQLAAHWDETRMDALLLLLPAAKAQGHTGRGDFLLSEEGRLIRAKGADGLVYLGAQILRPNGLQHIDNEVFSLNLLWDKMIDDGRAYGLVHQGGWCDVGHPEGIAVAEALLKEAPDV